MSALGFSPSRANHPVESLLATLLGVLLLFTLVTTIFFWHWVQYLNSALIGPPEDNMQDFWNTWYTAVAGNPDHFFFTDLIRFPEGTPLYYHSFAYPKVFAIALLSKFVGTSTTSLILLQNLSLLISFPLAGAGAFLSGAVSHREYGRRITGRLSLCLQSIARGACDASRSFFLPHFLYSICKSVSSSRSDFTHAGARSSFQLSKLATT